MPPAIVQAVKQAGSTATSPVNVPITGTVAGNKLIVGLTWTSATLDLNLGPSFTPLFSKITNGGDATFKSQAWISTAPIAGGSINVPVTFTPDATTVTFEAVVVEVSGLSDAPIDDEATASDGGTPSTSPSVTVTTAQPNQLVVGFVSAAVRTISAGAGYTVPTNGNSSPGTNGSMFEYQIFSTPGSHTVNASISLADKWMIGGAALFSGGSTPVGALSNLSFGSPSHFPYGIVQNPVKAAGSADVIPVASGEVFVTATGVDAMTLALPRAGVYPAGVPQSLGDPRDDGKELLILSTTAQAHTVTTPALGINGVNHILTFGGAVDDWIKLKAFNGTWWVVGSNGVVVS